MSKDDFLKKWLGEPTSSNPDNLQSDLDNLIQRLNRSSKGRKSLTRRKELTPDDPPRTYQDLIPALQEAFDLVDGEGARAIIAQLSELADQLESAPVESEVQLGKGLRRPGNDPNTELLFPNLNVRVRKTKALRPVLDESEPLFPSLRHIRVRRER